MLESDVGELFKPYYGLFRESVDEGLFLLKTMPTEVRNELRGHVVGMNLSEMIGSVLLKKAAADYPDIGVIDRNKSRFLRVGSKEQGHICYMRVAKGNENYVSMVKEDAKRAKDFKAQIPVFEDWEMYSTNLELIYRTDTLFNRIIDVAIVRPKGQEVMWIHSINGSSKQNVLNIFERKKDEEIKSAGFKPKDDVRRNRGSRKRKGEGESID